MQCKNCKKDFTIADEDKSFYTRIDVPEPTLCPDCRKQRRLSFRNDMTLYNRKSSKSGKQILSMYPEDVLFPVYSYDEWWAEDWDPLQYGQEFDFSRPFFEQFRELRDKVPRISVLVDNLSTNCQYSNQLSQGKDCYLVFAGTTDEECFYGYRMSFDKNCVDCFFTNKSELCYQCIDTNESYGCSFCQNISKCMESAFLYDCQGCNECFFCTGLRNESHCIFNKKYSKSEYQEKKKNFDFGSRKALEDMKKEFQKFILKYPRKYANLKKTVNVTGSDIQNAKNCRAVFDGFNVEDSAYCHFIQDSKDCLDVNYACDDTQLNYEVATTGIKAYNVKFSLETWPGANNLSYCDSCSNSVSDCFGCVALKRKKFCILNKQYNEEEYQKLLPKIIEQMKDTGEWGEFFPTSISPFCYNETVANDYYPLNKKKVLAKDWKWRDEMPGSKEKETIRDIPDHIDQVKDNIIEEILACSDCGKNYKIILQELEFYRKRGLSIPHHCPTCRHLERLNQRTPRKLWHRQCMCEQSDHGHKSRCSNEFDTTYEPDRPEKVYCEECYKKEIY